MKFPRKIVEKMTVYSEQEKIVKLGLSQPSIKKEKKLSYSDKLRLRFQSSKRTK